MRYIVIGAGAVGGSIGAGLFLAGKQVLLVARGAHRQAIATAGLVFATPRETRTLAMPVVGSPEEVDLDPDDVLILAVKIQDSGPALDSWSGRPVAGGGTAGTDLPLLCAQNGVEGERLALRRFDRVYGVCVVLPAGHLAPGRIDAIGDPQIGVLTIGAYPAGTDDLVDRICGDLGQAQITALPSPVVMRWKYTKLLANLGNALEAICGPIQGEALSAVAAAARSEGEQVLRAAGIDYADRNEDGGIHYDLGTAEIPDRPRGGGSTWQSLTRGTGTVEADYLSGEIALLGRLFGTPTPVNATLCRIVDDLARRGLPPGSVSVQDLTLQLQHATR